MASMGEGALEISAQGRPGRLFQNFQFVCISWQAPSLFSAACPYPSAAEHRLLA